jgi:hypothetical protein
MDKTVVVVAILTDKALATLSPETLVVCEVPMIRMDHRTADWH